MKLDLLNLTEVEELNVQNTEEIDKHELFEKRREKLREVSDKLKQDFVGLDAVIDRLIDNVEAWYLMPDSMTRPAIVCLWGMTGVGKTDLMRKFSKYLGFNDKYLEVQMTNNGTAVDNGYSSKTIQSKIEYSNLEPNTPGILLLDEIQRYRTKDERGQAIHGIQDQDVWQLLSDGKFASSVKVMELMDLLYGSMMWDYGARSYGVDEEEDHEDHPSSETVVEEVKKKKKPVQRTYYRGYRTAVKIKKLLKIEDDIKSIMKWTDEEKEVRAREALENINLFEGDDYSQLLIVISGNIDEAYKMSNDVADADIDADVLHQFSKRINFLTIKKALLQRFFPEQIARFGNNHIVYPALSKGSFQEVIDRRLNRIISDAKDRHNVTIKYDQNIRGLIYRNGVFPSQGVRPVFSTIYAIVESLIPKMVLYSMESEERDFNIDYVDTNLRVTTESGLAFEKEYLGDIDIIRQEKDSNSKILTAVHEAGHAIVYAKLFGVAPTQIECNATDAAEGFIGLHNINSSRNGIKNKISVLYGGYAAEELIFNDLTSGAQHDLTQATAWAKAMVKNYGMCSEIGVTAHTGLDPNERGRMDRFDKEEYKEVETILRIQRNRAERILTDYSGLLKRVAKKLYEEESISPSNFAEMCNDNGIETKVLAPKHTLIENYLDKFEKAGGFDA